MHTTTPHVPVRYGFAAYVLTTMATLSLLVWSFFPETCSKVLGVDLPNRYWAVAVPMWFCVTWGCFGCFFVFLVFLMTPGTEDASNVIDSTMASQTGWVGFMYTHAHAYKTAEHLIVLLLPRNALARAIPLKLGKRFSCNSRSLCVNEIVQLCNCANTRVLSLNDVERDVCRGWLQRS